MPVLNLNLNMRLTQAATGSASASESAEPRWSRRCAPRVPVCPGPAAGRLGVTVTVCHPAGRASDWHCQRQCATAAGSVSESESESTSESHWYCEPDSDSEWHLRVRATGSPSLRLPVCVTHWPPGRLIRTRGPTQAGRLTKLLQYSLLGVSRRT